MYEWKMYDVCQVNYGDGKWLDFATVKTADDAVYARLNVLYPEYAPSRYGWPHGMTATFRVVRGNDVVCP